MYKGQLLCFVCFIAFVITLMIPPFLRMIKDDKVEVDKVDNSGYQITALFSTNGYTVYEFYKSVRTGSGSGWHYVAIPSIPIQLEK